jgi:colicin import membrane protein
MQSVQTNPVVPFESKIAEYSPTAAAIADLRQRYANTVYYVATTAGLDAARKARAEVREYRTSLEKKRVEIKAPLLAREKLVDEEAARITAALLELEKPIDAQIKAAEAAAEERRQAKAKADAERVQRIRDRLTVIERLPLGLVNATAIVLRETIAAVVANPIIDAEWQEFAGEAKSMRDATLLTLSTILARAEQAEEAAAHAAKEAERVAEADRKLAAERAEHDAKVKAEAKRIADESAKADADRKAADDAAAAERKRLDDEAAAERKRQDHAAAEKKRKAAAEQEESERKDLEAQRRRLRDRLGEFHNLPNIPEFLGLLGKYAEALSAKDADAELMALILLCEFVAARSAPAVARA